MAVNTERLDQLIGAGEGVVSTEHSRRGFVDTHKFVNGEAFVQWRMSSLTFLEATYSRDNLYFQNFLELCQSETVVDTRAGLAVLRAVKDDISAEIEPAANSISISDLPLHPRIAEVSLGLYIDGHYAERN